MHEPSELPSLIGRGCERRAHRRHERWLGRPPSSERGIGESWATVANRLRGDIGGFGAGSEFAWYVNAFASRRLTDGLALTFGYRVWGLRPRRRRRHPGVRRHPCRWRHRPDVSLLSQRPYRTDSSKGEIACVKGWDAQRSRVAGKQARATTPSRRATWTHNGHISERNIQRARLFIRTIPPEL